MASHLYLIQTERLDGTLLPGVEMRALSPNGDWAGITNPCGQFAPSLAAGAYAVDFFLNGQKIGHRDWVLGDPPQSAIRVGLDVAQSLPPVPSRDEVCGLRLTFQGLTVQTQQFGAINWFEPWLVALNAQDRSAVYAAKHAVGDRHCIIEFFPGGPIYNETPFQVYVSPDYEANPGAFRALVVEIIQAGFVPVVVFDGDNGDNPADGYPNALRQLPILAGLLGDLSDRILFARFWDGVFYGSTPENIKAFGHAFRQHLPNGYLAIEHQPGRIPVGNGPADYAVDGMMADYDVIVSEFQDGLPRTSDPNPDTNPGSSIWMVVDRMVRPFHRPSDMPSGQKWDPAPPFYLESGSARGRYFYCAFEWNAYEWVRGKISAADIEANRQYLKAMGCEFTG